MYGIINKSLRDMVVAQFGEERWQKVLQRSGVPSDSFLAMRAYDDEITYKLAQAAADELNINLDDALRVFGVHWVEHTLKKNYDVLVSAAGSHLVEFLANLNSLHDRITSTFLDYQPPEFTVETLASGNVEVFYISQREGLTPFVEGLLKGLGSRFNEEVEILKVEQLSVSTGAKARFELRLS